MKSGKAVLHFNFSLCSYKGVLFHHRLKQNAKLFYECPKLRFSSFGCAVEALNTYCNCGSVIVLITPQMGTMLDSHLIYSTINEVNQTP